MTDPVYEYLSRHGFGNVLVLKSYWKEGEVGKPGVQRYEVLCMEKSGRYYRMILEARHDKRWTVEGKPYAFFSIKGKMEILKVQFEELAKGCKTDLNIEQDQEAAIKEGNHALKSHGRIKGLGLIEKVRSNDETLKKRELKPTKLYFGEYKGKTLEWILFHNPGYFLWIRGEGIQNNSKFFSSQALSRFNDLLRRARHLRIPGLCHRCRTNPIEWAVLIDDLRGKLAGVEFSCGKCKLYCGAAVVPSFFHTPSFDKLGTRILIDAIKYAYFGDKSISMTQKRMEEFFDIPNNFVNF